MALNSIELCSSALVKLGADGISSFEDGTAEARVAARLYPITRDGMLSAHPWTFATAQADLPRLATAPLSDFSYAFQLPNDFLRALSAGDRQRDRGMTYQIVNRELHSNHESVVLRYLFQPSEGDFPAYFVTALVAKLATEFCLPLTENSSRTERLASLAESELRLAKLADSQQHTPGRVEDYTLIRARLA